MKDINIQLNELQEFLDFVNERDKQLWERYGIGKPVHLYNRKYYTDADSTRIMNKYNRLRHLSRRDNFNINNMRY